MADWPPAGQPGTSLLAWSADGHRLMPAVNRPVAPAVADSWLTNAGRVRGLWLHRERFAAACLTRYAVPAPVTAEFFDAACLAVPLCGRWFPRIEFHLGCGFLLRLRPAPDMLADVVLMTADEPDPRREPTIKGPDLGMLLELRNAASSVGASEVLLVGRDGAVLEGALSSVMWWRGDTLCLACHPLIFRSCRALLEILFSELQPISRWTFVSRSAPRNASTARRSGRPAP